MFGIILAIAEIATTVATVAEVAAFIIKELDD